MSLDASLAALIGLAPEQRVLYKGIEKEGLRVQGQRIAQDRHPTSLGSTLTHPWITTDYSEALLEFITPVYSHADDLMVALQAMHSFSLPELGEQYIWPGSMPCIIDDELDVSIAEYGSSHQGKLKHVYRHGLWHRYGRIMQSIAGLHYNFSVGDAIWQQLADAQQQSDNAEFRTQGYFHLIRNFRRYQWLLLYLFSASNGFDSSFNVGRASTLPRIHQRSHLISQATSLRMSDIGYSNNVQQDFFVCFNGLNTYISTLERALNQPYGRYQEIGVRQGDDWRQLNDKLLQIENEYYSDIRPKRVGLDGEKPLEALAHRGVEYIEVRCLDLNPFLPLGVNSEQIRFLDLFLLWCLLKDSPKLSDQSCQLLRDNQLRTLMAGQDQATQLLDESGVARPLRTWGAELLNDMQPLAAWLEEREAGTEAALQAQQQKLQGLAPTPGQQLTQSLMAGEEYVDLMQTLGLQHKEWLMSQSIDPMWAQRLREAGPASLAQQAEWETQSHGDFADYLEQWLTRAPSPQL